MRVITAMRVLFRGASLLPVPILLDCPGSLISVTGLQPLDRGNTVQPLDRVRCDFCEREVVILPPTTDDSRDPGEG